MPTSIRLNGSDATTNAVTIAALLAETGIEPDRKGIAVALNGAVVRRGAWDSTPVASGDEVEIIRAMSGG